MKNLKRYEYRLMGSMPEVPEGHEFYSDIRDLQNFPELWSGECPYSFSSVRDVDVEFVRDTKEVADN